MLLIVQNQFNILFDTFKQNFQTNSIVILNTTKVTPHWDLLSLMSYENFLQKLMMEL